MGENFFFKNHYVPTLMEESRDLRSQMPSTSRRTRPFQKMITGLMMAGSPTVTHLKYHTSQTTNSAYNLHSISVPLF